MSEKENLGRLSDFEKGWIVGLHKEGVGYKKIAEKVKHPGSTVSSFLQRYNERGQNHHHHSASGPTSKVNNHTKRHII